VYSPHTFNCTTYPLTDGRNSAPEEPGNGDELIHEAPGTKWEFIGRGVLMNGGFGVRSGDGGGGTGPLGKLGGVMTLVFSIIVRDIASGGSISGGAPKLRV